MSDFDQIFAAAEEDVGPEGIPSRGRVMRLDRVDIVGRRPPPARGLLDYAADAGRVMTGDLSAVSRLGEDVRSAFDPATPHGTTGIDHMVQIPTAGFADEIRGLTRATMGAVERGELLDAILANPSPTGGGAHTRLRADYVGERDRARRELAEGAEERPGLAALGTATGIAASIPISPSVPVGGAATPAARVLSGMATGGAYGAAGGVGGSEAELSDVPATVRAGVTGGVGGALLGGTIGAAGEGYRRMVGRSGSMTEAADRARIGATAGPGPGLTDRAVRELAGANPSAERLAEVAGRLRRLGIAPAAGTTEDVLRLAREATEGLDTQRTGLIEEILAASPDGEGRIPVSRVLEELDRVAGELEGSVATRAYAPMVRARAREFSDIFATGPDGTIDLDATIPYERLGREISDLNQLTQWLDPEAGAVRVPTRVARDTVGALRDVQDEFAASVTSPELADRLRGIRGDMRVSLGAEEAAERGLSRRSRHALVGLGDIGAANVGAAGPEGSLGRAGLLLGARRMLEARGPSLRATGLETVARLLGSNPERLGAWGPVLTRAASLFGGIEAAHATLMDREPEYAAAVEELEASEEEAPEAPAEPVTGDSFAEMWDSLPEDTE